jgi:hypothetical protein
MSAQGQKLHKESGQQYTKDMSNKTNVFKIECCGSYGQLPTEKNKTKVCRFLSEIVSKKRLLSCSQ